MYLYAFVTELERDRVGVISGEGMGDGTVAVVVDSSLRMLNQFTQAVLKSLAVAPEDVSSVFSNMWIPVSLEAFCTR